MKHSFTLNPAQLTKLTALFQSQNITLAYQFGSSVTGNMHSESDIDFAIYFGKRRSPKAYFKLRLAMICELERIIKREVDLIILDAVPSIALRHEVISKGILLYATDRSEHAVYSSRIMAEYFDFVPFLKLRREAYVAKNR